MGVIYQTNYYTIVDGPTWLQAQSNAVSLGGNLVSINNAQEHSWIASEFSKAKYYYPGDSNTGDPDTWTHLWLGGTDQNTEGQWEWISGESWTFDGWVTGVLPNNVGDGVSNYLLGIFNVTSPPGGAGQGPGTYFWEDCPNIGGNAYKGIAEIPITNGMNIELSGDIDNDITLSNLTINLTGDLQINGTLTIGENVQINGNGYKLISKGEIKIEGNTQNASSQSVQYLKDLTIQYGPSSSSSDDHRFSIDSYALTNVTIQPATGYAVYGSFSITNSYIYNPQGYTYIWYPESDVLISGNTFELKDSNWRLSIGHGSSPARNQKVNIKNNIFKEHNGTQSLIKNWASYGTSQTQVTNNTFIDPSSTIFETPSGYTSANIFGSNNTISVTGSSNNDINIESFILDQTDDANRTLITDRANLFSGNTVPFITGPSGSTGASTSSKTINENTTAVHTFTANEPITWSLNGGADASKFSINSSTGALTFSSAPDFESPNDADSGNNYIVIVRATDTSSDTSDQTITINIADIDDTAPNLSSSSPADNATAVAINSNIVLTFSEAVDVENGSILIKKTSDNSTVESIDVTGAQVTGSGSNQITINPSSNLASSTQYYLQIPTTAFDDPSSNSFAGISDTTSLSFTTADVIDPNITGPSGSVGASTSTKSINENTTAVHTFTANEPVTWSLNGGADASKFSINSSTGALIFNSAPDFESPTDSNSDHDYIVVVRATDTSSNTSDQTVTVSVDNTHPVITGPSGSAGASTSSKSINENSTAIHTFTSDESVTWSLHSFGSHSTSQNDVNYFSLNSSTGALTFKSPPDYESPTDADSDHIYKVQVKATDSSSTYSYQTVSISVVDIDPNITGPSGSVGASTSTKSINENTTAVHTFTANEPVTWSLNGGADASKFSINSSTGALIFNSAPDFESPTDSNSDHDYIVVVRATDLDSHTSDQTVTVSVDNTHPVITGPSGSAGASTSSKSINENSTAIHTFTSDESVTWSLHSFGSHSTSQNDVNYFSLNSSTGALTFKSPPDYESPTDADSDHIYKVQVKATDSSSTYSYQTVSISVVDIDPNITGPSGSVGASTSTKSINENTTAVHTFTANEPVTWSLNGGADASKFSINSSTGALIFNSAPDFESPTDSNSDHDYIVVVRATDLDSHTSDQTVTVSVDNTHPVITGPSGSAGASTSSKSINENSTAIHTFTSDESVTWSLHSFGSHSTSQNDVNYFSLNSSTGALTFKSPPDYESPTDADSDHIYKVQVKATDSSSTYSYQTVSISVVDIDPNITGPSGSVGASTSTKSINENTTAVHTFTANEPVTWSLNGGADASKFSINSSTGALIFNSAPDFESPTDSNSDHDYIVVVRATDLDSHTSDQTVTVSVDNTHPVITGPSGSAGASTSSKSINENSTAIHTFTSDESVTWSLHSFGSHSTSQNDVNYFSLNSSTGALTFKSPPDYESPTDADSDHIYKVQVKATDSSSTYSYQTVSISVVDIDPNITGPSGSVGASTSTKSINENTTAVHTFTANEPVTWSLNGGADASKFSINSSTGALIFNSAPDFESPTDSNSDHDYIVVVRATDLDSHTSDQTVTVSVDNTHPVITGPSGSAGASTSSKSINENSTAIHTFTSDESVTWSLHSFGSHSTSQNDVNYFSLNSSTGALTFKSPPDYESPTDADSDHIYKVQVKATDSSSTYSYQTVSISVVDIDPNITGPSGSVGASTSTKSINENTTAVHTFTANEPVTWSLNGGADASKFSINSSTGALIFNSAPDFESPTDSNSDHDYIVVVRATDLDSHTSDQTVTVSVDNTHPVITGPSGSAGASTSSKSINENSTAIHTFTSDESVTWSLHSFGSHSTSQNDVNYFSLNSSTGALTFKSPPDYESPTDADSDHIYKVQVKATDSSSTYSYQTVSISVQGVNETPSNISLSSSSFNENISSNSIIATLSTSDVDSSDSHTYSLVTGAGDGDNTSFTLDGNNLKINSSPDYETKSTYNIRLKTTDAAGLSYIKPFTLAVQGINETPSNISLSSSSFNENINSGSAVAELSSSDPDSSDTHTYSFISGSGDTDNNSFTIDDSSLKIKASPDYETKSTYNIRLKTTDAAGLSYIKPFTLAVQGINETPSNISLSSSSFNENISSNSIIATLSTSDVDSSDSHTYSLVTGAGDGDNTSFTLDGNNLKINSSPDYETKSTYNIRLKTTDAAGLSYIKPFTLAVQGINETPSNISLSSSSFNENINSGSAVAELSSSDPDSSDTHTYSFISGSGDTDNNSFTIDDSSLKIKASPDYETKSSYSIRLQTTDSGNETYAKAFSFSVNNLNETPSNISLSSSSFNENINSGSAVAELSSSDPDSSDTHTYSFISGSGDTDNNSFTIDGSSLKIKASPDYETKSSYSIRLQTTDSGGETYAKAFSFSVNNLNETPSNISLSSSSFNESISSNSIIATLSTSDVDSSDSHTYSLVTGAGDGDNSAFTLDGSNLKINSSPDYETKSTYNIRLKTTDAAGLSYIKPFTLFVNKGPNQNPNNISLSSSSFNENISSNSIIATLSTSDVDSSDTHTYSLVTGAGDGDNSAFTLDGNNLKINSSPDYETKSTYNIRLKTTDAAGLSYIKPFTLAVQGVNETPSNISLSSSSFNENINSNSIIATLSTSDVDSSDTHTYSLVTGAGDGDNSSFTLDGSNLKINSSPDYETKSTYNIRLKTTDAGGEIYEKAMTLIVGDINETPTSISLSNLTFNESINSNSIIAILSTSDIDSSDTHTYSLVTGAGSEDNSAFTLDGSTLKIISSPDYETKSTYNIRLKTTDAAGLSYIKPFTLAVQGVNETPSNISLSSSSFNENINSNSIIATLSTSDVDSSDTHTYSLVTGAGDGDNSAFTLDGSNLKINSSPDYDTKSTYNIRLKTTDAGGLDYIKSFTLLVNDVNDAPSGLAISSSRFNENIAAGSTIATLTSTDPDASETHTYVFVTGSGDTDNDHFTIDGNSIKIKATPDYETKSYYNIRVKTLDNSGDYYEKTFTLSVNDLNAPTGISLTASSFDENINANSTIAVLASTDADATDTHTFSFINGTGDTDNNAFIIDGNRLKIKDSPDYETQSSYNIRLQSKDSGGETYEKGLILSVNDVVIDDPNDFKPTLTGSAGNETIQTTSGNDVIDGLDGTDTLTITGNFSDYAFTRGTDTLQIADQRTTGTTDGTDTLKNIEYIQFSDQTVEESKVDVVKTYSGNYHDYKFYHRGNGKYEIKTDSGYDDITGYPLLRFSGEDTTSALRDVSAIADIKATFDQVTGLTDPSGEMFQLYNAAFKRFPDAEGLKYWINVYSSGINTKKVVAASFVRSAEFKSRYGENVTTEEYVTTLYRNVFDRLPDEDGFNYWVGSLNKEEQTRSDVLMNFAISNENDALFTEMTGLS
ncbi:cadherin domain-containing protein [Prochlorococcus marinus]|uniref:cadherin domain-containing protein n=1 Tax=Prochlorococcus marinus TaxID=1219 RepID=UPI0022B56EA1|nr:cadherin domain-containing protein [Prochlorococcus marinus]